MTSGTDKPVYVLHGTDSFLRDSYRQEIVASVIGQADPQLCLSTFEATAELAEVLDELRTPSFLAPRRVVIVRDADAFVSAYRDSLEKYLSAPAASAVLMLIVSTWKRTWRLAKLVDKIGQVCDCSAADGAKLVGWVEAAAKKRGVKIDPQAAELLVQMMGQDLAALDSEIEKLSLYVGDRQRVGVQDVGAVVTATAGPVAFAMTNAIAAGDVASALRALARMLTRRGEEFRVLGSVGWHLRRALATREDIDAGQSPQLHMPYPQRQAFLNYVRRRSPTKLRADFRRLIRADLALKTGSAPTSALQTLLVELCA